MSAEQLCRIFHISDLHFVTTETQKNVSHAAHPGARAFSRVFTQGTAPHDPQTLAELERAIRNEVDSDAGWQTFIIATGDLSTWGDRESVEGARRLILKLANDIGAKDYVLFGNHDVWPGEEPWFPFLATTPQILAAEQRSLNLLGGLSTIRRPFDVTIELHRLNTVIADRFLNTVAWGKLQEASLKHLEAERSDLDCIGIALTHHPVHDTKHRYAFTTLLNAPVAAEAMRCDDGPRIRLVLSGHQHQPNPAPGDMAAALNRGQPPLSARQIQLTAGTASQRPERSRAPHNSFQMLRLGLNKHDRTLAVERTTFQQPNGIGSFVKLGEGGGVSEICTIPIG